MGNVHNSNPGASKLPDNFKKRKAARGDCKGFGGKFEITCYGRADFVLNRGGNKKSF